MFEFGEINDFLDPSGRFGTAEAKGSRTKIYVLPTTGLRLKSGLQIDHGG